MMSDAGYSGTPLAKKLGVRAGMWVVLVGAPEGFVELLGELPEGVEVSDAPDLSGGTLPTGRVSACDVLHIFTNSREGLFRGLDAGRRAIRQDGAIWVSWYKKAAKLPTEITEDTIREAALPLGLVDVKVCAVDEKWSGLKLVIRKENRI
jgi:hypothetical protein